MKKKLVAYALSVVIATMPLTACGNSQGNTSAAEQSASTSTEAALDEQQSQYSIYLGTNDKDTNKPMDFEKTKERLVDILLERFDGYTITDADGGWIGDDGIEYRERSLVIVLTQATDEEVHALADVLLAEFNQASVLIEKDLIASEFYSNPDATADAEGTAGSAEAADSAEATDSATAAEE